MPKVHFEEPLKAQNRYFLETIANRKTVKRSGGRFALGVVKVLEAINESIKRQGSPVAVKS